MTPKADLDILPCIAVSASGAGRACLLAFIYYFLVVLGFMLGIFRVLGP